MTFTEKVLGNKRYKRFIEGIEDGTLYNLNMTQLYKDVKQRQCSREVRLLTLKTIKKNFKSTLISVTLQNQQFRSDCVDRKRLVYDSLTTIDNNIEELKDFLKLKYAEEYAKLGAQNNKSAALDTLFSLPKRKKKTFEAFIKSVDMVIEDIDESKWMIQNIQKIMERNESKGAEL